MHAAQRQEGVSSCTSIRGEGQGSILGAERSQSQVMCRTGLGGPGSTERFVYGKKRKFATEDQATAAAIKWVQAEKKNEASSELVV